MKEAPAPVPEAPMVEEAKLDPGAATDPEVGDGAEGASLVLLYRPVHKFFIILVSHRIPECSFTASNMIKMPLL